MPLHHLANFEIQKYYQNKTGFNGVYSRHNVPKIKGGAYVIFQKKLKRLLIVLYIKQQIYLGCKHKIQ